MSSITLSKDSLSHILPFLGRDDLSTAASVCSEWRDEALQVARSLEQRNIEKFLNSLAEWLKKPYPSITKSLRAMREKLSFTHTQTLKGLRLSVESHKRVIAEVLGKIDTTELEQLSEIARPPLFLEGVFESARVHHQFQSNSSILDPQQRAVSIGDFAYKVLTHSPDYEAYIDQTIVTLRRNSPEPAYWETCRALLSKGDLARAVLFIPTIPYPLTRTVALNCLFAQFIERRQFKQALKVAALMQQRRDQLKALRKIPLAVFDYISPPTAQQP